MNEPLARKLAADSAATDAWVTFAAIGHYCDTDTILDCLAGRRPTGDLPEDVAVGVIERLDDTDTAISITAGDGRVKVRAALAAAGHCTGTLPPADEPMPLHRTDIEGVGARIADSLRNRNTNAAAAAAAVLGVLAGTTKVVGFDHTRVEHRFGAISSILDRASRAGVERRLIVHLPLELLEPADRAALLAWGTRDHPAITPLMFASVDQLLAAITELTSRTGLALTWRGSWVSADELAVDLATYALSTGLPVNGAQGIVDAWVGGGQLDDGTIAALIDGATTVDRPDAVDDLIAYATDGGRTVRPLGNVHIDKVTADVNVDAFACAYPAADGGYVDGVSLASSAADSAALLDAFERHRPELTDSFLEQLPHVAPVYMYAKIHPAWRDASMSRHGLAPWVEQDPASRNALLTAGDGIGGARWATIATLLPTFAGTPTELVAVACEVAPPDTATPQLAAS